MPCDVATWARPKRLWLGLGSIASTRFDLVMSAVEDGGEVHRVVLIERAWDLVPLVGEERASAMLRQSLHYCIKNEEWASQQFADLRASYRRCWTVMPWIARLSAIDRFPMPSCGTGPSCCSR
ncbi:MAG: hypothetical protein R3B96_02555 [Pirellulaceae bacterium]